MVHYRLLLIAAAAVAAAAAACAPMPLSAPAELAKATDFEAAISRLKEDDPQSPETLNLRLEYANFLSGAAGADCQQRLAAAQSQLDIVAGMPATDAVLPLGPAQIADDEYKIHLARATCGGGQTPLKSELQQALEAAQHAVELYRDALDYQSTAIMQFNVAATYQELADANGAVSALEAAIAMDREYGFRKDAEDNSRLLLQWNGGEASDGDVAAQMKDFPAHSVDFKFNWSNSDEDVAVNADDTSIIHGKIIRSRATIGLNRHVRADTQGWTVSNEPGSGSYDLGDWPADAKVSEWSTLYFLASALLQAPRIEIGRDGDFNSVANPQAFATGLAAQISAQISARIGNAASGGGPASENAIMRDLNAAFSPEFIESRATQDYELETATWIGVKLEQGVWYQISAPLFLPGLGLGHYIVQHDISFAFTRRVPCMTGSPDRLCVEIVVHATPDADDLSSALQEADPQLKLSDRQALHCWSRTDMRLVIDPDTLRPYIRDIRQTWYDGVGKNDPIIELVRTVSTSVYR
jgi:tetratricopeptide (TPR) repeat protein